MAKQQETISRKQHEEALFALRMQIKDKEDTIQQAFNKRVRDTLVYDLVGLRTKLITNLQEDVKTSLSLGYSQSEIPSRHAVVQQEINRLEEIISNIIGFPFGKIKLPNA